MGRKDISGEDKDVIDLFIDGDLEKFFKTTDRKTLNRMLHENRSKYLSSLHQQNKKNEEACTHIASYLHKRIPKIFTRTIRSCDTKIMLNLNGIHLRTRNNIEKVELFILYMTVHNVEEKQVKDLLNKAKRAYSSKKNRDKDKALLQREYVTYEVRVKKETFGKLKELEKKHKFAPDTFIRLALEQTTAFDIAKAENSFLNEALSQITELKERQIYVESDALKRLNESQEFAEILKRQEQRLNDISKAITDVSNAVNALSVQVKT